LLEGVEPRAGAFKKIQLLRPAAARDPLNNDGEWKLIRADDRVFLDFKQSVLKYNGGMPPATSARYKAFEPLGAMQGGMAIGLDDDKDDEATCDLDTSPNETATPFIGVASRSRCPSVTTYYGIERHDGWVFTPVYRYSHFQVRRVRVDDHQRALCAFGIVSIRTRSFITRQKK
jgi:hypothetical protein